MILVGSQRGGAASLARHLTADENDHVRVHELRGFMADDLNGAFREAYALSRGTKCRQFLYSLSLNPPPGEAVPEAVFEQAVDRIEAELGLAGQPRAIVFHEKEGRRHAHAVWSRIDAESMTAINLSFPKRKLQTLARELFIEHGWNMPQGFVDPVQTDPTNFTLDEWQHAKRVGQDPRHIKTMLQDAWAISDSAAAFVHALQERGYKLARGDRRGFVAVDRTGEVFAIPKWVGVKTKEVRARLGSEAALPSVKVAQRAWAEELNPAFDRMSDASRQDAARRAAVFDRRKTEQITKRRVERANLYTRHADMAQVEAKERQARFRKGLSGLWDRLRGAHGKTKRLDEREAEASLKRDARERDAMTAQHLSQRRTLIRARKVELEQVRERRQTISAERDRRFGWSTPATAPTRRSRHGPEP